MASNLLLKFGAFRHIGAFLARGELWLSPLKEYRRAEHVEQRKDPIEGMLRQSVLTDGTLLVSRSKSGPWYEMGEDFRFVERHTNRELLTLNVFCLYMLTFEDNDDRHIGRMVSDEVITGFGDSAVVIFDPVEFLSRTKGKAESLGFSVACRPVKYQDLAAHSGDVGPFVKDASYARQQEFRIAVADPDRNGGALKLEIGSIEDIAHMMPAAGVRDLIFDVSEPSDPDGRVKL